MSTTTMAPRKPASPTPQRRRSTVRGLMIGGPVAANLMWTLVWMAGLLVVFVALALRAYRRRA